MSNHRVTHAVLKREHGYTGSYSAVRRMLGMLKRAIPPQTTVRLSFAPVEALLENTGILSVDEMKSFKPNPGVYGYFLRQAQATGSDAWLVSSNPFDVIEAISAGMRAA